jgi:hypothetical protein
VPGQLPSGVCVVDGASEPAATTRRVLADLGADAVLVGPPGGSALGALPDRFLFWAACKRGAACIGADDPGLERDPDEQRCPRDEGAVE